MGPDTAPALVAAILASDADESTLRALAAPSARYAVYFLLDRDRASVEELADVVTGWHAATGEDVRTVTDRDRVRTALYHNHLPRLDESGIVSFDPGSRWVELCDMDGPLWHVIETAYAVEHPVDEAIR